MRRILIARSTLGQIASENNDHTQPAKDALKAINDAISLISNDAQVMMHSSDRQGRLLRLNRLWTRTLGYDPVKVLGKK